MEIITKQIEMNQEVKRLTDQFVLDEDFNVPDSKNDVEKIVSSEGILHIDEIRPVENYLRVQGYVKFQILYMAEGIEPVFSGLEGKIPFVEMVYVEEKANLNYELQHARAEIAVQMIHSRKLRIKAMGELNLVSAKQNIEEIPTDVEGSVFKKEKQLELLQLHTSKKDTYRIKEEITLPGTKESIGVILWSDISNRKTDTRLVVDELQIFGELLVFCFYESPDGRIDWVEQTVPYQGRIACHGIDEMMYHYAEVHLEEVHADARIDEDGEMRIIGIEGTLRADVAVYEEETIDLLEDFYSLESKCIPEFKTVTYEQLVVQNHSKCKVMERLSVPELNKEVLQICHSRGSVRIDRMEQKEDGVLIEGALYISFLYVKANDTIPFDTWHGAVPFSHLVECDSKGETLKFQISAILEQLSITLQGGDEIEVKAALSFCGLFRNVGKMEMVQSVRIEPLSTEEIEAKPSIVGYIVKEGDDLWSLAKHYGTTKESIAQANELASETLKAGDRLLIFKENMGIL